MKTLHFKAYDHVSGNWFFSKDFNSLKDFFDSFDNVQHSIHLVSRGEEILKLIEQSENKNNESQNESKKFTNESSETNNSSKSLFDPNDLFTTLGDMLYKNNDKQRTTTEETDENKSNFKASSFDPLDLFNTMTGFLNTNLDNNKNETDDDKEKPFPSPFDFKPEDLKLLMEALEKSNMPEAFKNIENELKKRFK
jgi:hypothetical protein